MQGNAVFVSGDLIFPSSPCLMSFDLHRLGGIVMIYSSMHPVKHPDILTCFEGGLFKAVTAQSTEHVRKPVMTCQTKHANLATILL